MLQPASPQHMQNVLPTTVLSCLCKCSACHSVNPNQILIFSSFPQIHFHLLANTPCNTSRSACAQEHHSTCQREAPPALRRQQQHQGAALRSG